MGTRVTDPGSAVSLRRTQSRPGFGEKLKATNALMWGFGLLLLALFTLVRGRGVLGSCAYPSNPSHCAR